LPGYELAMAGAASIDGLPCGDDRTARKSPAGITCAQIPRPHFASGGACTAAGCPVTLTIAGNSVQNAILDDCAVAHSRTNPGIGSPASAYVDCPRNNLAGGFQVLMKRASCSTPPTDLRTFGTTATAPLGASYPNTPASGTATATRNWLTFSREDLNLNGVINAGEDGSNGGTPGNGLDIEIVALSLTSTTKSIFVPTIPLATDCLYLGLALRADPNAITFLGRVHEPVLSHYVSMNPIPLEIAQPTPVTDTVPEITAREFGGKVTITWTSAAEFTTDHFIVRGVRGAQDKGSTVDLATKPAQFGTTGEGFTYTVELATTALKGSKKIAIVVVHTTAGTPDKTFGPVDIQ
jgi:hypothetical protein